MKDLDHEKSESTSHMEAFIYRVPKRNHEAIVKNLKKFMPWFEENGVKLEYYQFVSNEAMEGMESIVKTLSAGEDEEIWMELQYFRDQNHHTGVYAKMMQDKKLEPLGAEFFSLISQGKSVVTGGFNRLQ